MHGVDVSEEVSLIQIKKGYIIIERACSVSTLYFHKLSACCSRALLEGKQASEGKFSRKRLRGVGAFAETNSFAVSLWGVASNQFLTWGFVIMDQRLSLIHSCFVYRKYYICYK